MNNPNPLIPKGSLLEQEAQSKPHLRIALCIVAVHLIFLGGLLMQGCKRDDPEETGAGATKAQPEFASAQSEFSSLSNRNPYVSPMTPADTNVPPAEGYVVPGLPPLPLGVDPGDGEPGEGTITNVPIIPTDPIDPIDPLLVSEPPPTPEPPPVERTHKVVGGDTFYGIGRQYGVSVTEIAQANPGVDPVRLQVGQVLQIPSPTVAAPNVPDGGKTYKVRPKDTLFQIARDNATTVEAIMRLNKLETTQILVGQKLRLP